MSFDEFLRKYKERFRNYSDKEKTGCIEILNAYLENNFGIARINIAEAKDFFIRFEQFEQLAEKFTKIYYSDDFVPVKGDICVWGSGVGQGHGHVSVATGEGNIKYFYSYDISQNKKHLKRTRNNYRYFLGVLRAKGKIIQQKNNKHTEKFANRE